jgi:beta-1,3-glucuronyltransferase
MKQVGLWRFLGNDLAERVQSALGDWKTEELASKIGQQLHLFCSRRAPQISEEAKKTPTVYVMTTTYRRPEQQAELTRLAQTLMNVQNIYWLLCEDASEKSDLVSRLLKK